MTPMEDARMDARSTDAPLRERRAYGRRIDCAEGGADRGGPGLSARGGGQRDTTPLEGRRRGDHA